MVDHPLSIGNVDPIPYISRAWAYANSKPGNMCAIWGGAQTSPQFLFSRLANAPHNGICHANALVKLGFEPVAQNSDIISISLA